MFPREYEGFKKVEEKRKIKEVNLQLIVQYKLNQYVVDIIKYDEFEPAVFYILGKNDQRVILDKEAGDLEDAWSIAKKWIKKYKIKASIS